MKFKKQYTPFLLCLFVFICIVIEGKNVEKRVKNKRFYSIEKIEKDTIQDTVKNKIKNTKKTKDGKREKEKDTTDITDIADSLSVGKDTIVKTSSALKDIVAYHAKDSVSIDKNKKLITMYNQTQVKYTDTELKAGINTIDYNKTEVHAGRIKDSLGQYTQIPVFTQADQVIEPDSIKFNYRTKKAIIRNAYTDQMENHIKASVIKKENDSVYFLRKGIITTAEDIDNPDYYILLQRAKFIPNKRVVAGFSNMFIADVPTPIALPFAYYPMVDTRSSGVIMPTYGQANDRGYYLQNGGYYFAINNYLDLTLTGDYYTNGSYGLSASMAYVKKYRFSGNFNLRYENLIYSEKGFPDYSRNSVYNVQWSHSQDSKSSPLSSFSASVNLGSSTYYKDSYNQMNSSNFMNNTLSSSVSYSHRFPIKPEVNMSITASHSQNTNTKQIDMTLPSLRASVARIYPFAKEGQTKKGIIKNINLQYSLQAESRYDTNEEHFMKKEMFDKAKNGIRHSIPIATNFKVMKYLSFSLNASLNETWQFKTIRYRDYDPVAQEAIKDTISGFDRFLTYNAGANMGTTLYGTFNFGKNKKIQAIRHILRPSMGFGYSPSFDKYYDYYVYDAFGREKQYTRFESGIYGSPGLSQSQTLSFSLSNSLEAKVRSKDSTVVEPKKVMLLSSLNLNSGYNLITKKYNPVTITGGTQIFNNKVGVNFGGTLNPYAIDNTGRQMDKFNIDNGGSLFRFTNANLSLNYSFSSRNFKKKEDPNTKNSGGRDDDLFGSSLTRGSVFTKEKQEQGEIREREEEKKQYYKSYMPWDLRLAYSLSYSNTNRNPAISNNSLMVSGNIDLTPKWRVGASTGYDFVGKGITYTQLRFERDLGSFYMSFNTSPFGYRSSWNFFIGIKAPMLSDLKWEKTNPPDREVRR